MDDDDLRTRLRAGDTAALGLLRERHGEAIYGACYRVLRNHAETEDTVHEALLLAWRYRTKVAAAASIRSYAVEIGKNAARDHIRKSARRSDLVRANAAALEPEPSAGDDMDRSTRDALGRCLTALEADPRTYRSVLMRIQDEASWSDIAKAIAPPLEEVDTIRMRVTRALRALRDCMEGQGVSL